MGILISFMSLSSWMQVCRKVAAFASHASLYLHRSGVFCHLGEGAKMDPAEAFEHSVVRGASLL